MGTRPGPDNWVEWDGGATTTGFYDTAYGNGRWSVIKTDSSGGSPVAVTVHATEDARRTDAWPQVKSLTGTVSASTTYLTGLHFGGGVWAIAGSGYVTYSRDNWATVSQYALSTTGNFQSFKWQYDRWLRINSGTIYQAFDIAGPWTTVATTATLGFTPAQVAFNGERFVVGRTVATNTITPVPAIVYSDDGGASWTTWYMRTNGGSTSSLTPHGLAWYEDQQEWAAFWGPASFNNTFIGTPHFVTANGVSWYPISPQLSSSTLVMIGGVTGNGWQVITYRSNQTGGVEPSMAYRQADTWESTAAWSSTPNVVGSVSPRGLTSTIKYGDGYWVTSHDNAPSTNFNTRGRVIASPEIDDSFWGISLDDWN